MEGRRGGGGRSETEGLSGCCWAERGERGKERHFEGGLSVGCYFGWDWGW